MHKKVIIILVIIIFAVAGWLYSSGFFKNNPGVVSPPTSQTQPPKTPPEDTFACVEALPTDVKIGQKLMAAGYSTQLADERAILRASNIGGVLIMDQTSAATLQDFRNAQAIAPLIAIDQEGGTVQRYTDEGTIPGATDMASGFSADQAYQTYLQDDMYLKQQGITTNFAPVVDVISTNPSPLPGRMYSSDPATVTAYASEAVKAATMAGITPVIKHFPGLGSATSNTDYASATTDSLDILKARDLIPYVRLASLHPDVMVSNAIVPGLTNGQPAIWSAEAIKLLRSEGYQQAVIYTDSLTAKAIPGQLDDAAVKAWKAGTDIALIVQTTQQTPELSSDFQAIITKTATALQSGELNSSDFSQSVARILTRKGIDACQLKNKLAQ